MATDIAFALAVLYLFGKRVPIGLKVLLATLAVLDDIMSILVIAIFYTSELSLNYFLWGLGIVGILFFMNWRDIRAIGVYLIFGIVLWYFFLQSGIHPTLAGVITAFAIPATTTIDFPEFKKTVIHFSEQLVQFVPDDEIKPEYLPIYLDTVHRLEEACEEVQAPIYSLEETLAPWVAFLIIPIFAFANSGIPLDLNTLGDITDPIALGILFGLLIGKPIGIIGSIHLAVKSGIANLPVGVTWRHIYGMGFLAGIGFTMSMLISELALAEPHKHDVVKLAIILASLISATIGYVLIRKAVDEARGGSISTSSSPVEVNPT